MLKVGNRVYPSRTFDWRDKLLNDQQRKIIGDYAVQADGRIVGIYLADLTLGRVDPDSFVYLICFTITDADDIAEDEIGEHLDFEVHYLMTRDQFVTDDEVYRDEDDTDEDDDDD